MLNKIIAKSLPLVPKSVVKIVASRYIAGETLPDAVKTVKNLNALGAVGTVDVLGEFVHNRAQAEASVRHSDAVLDAIHQHSLQSGLSVKLTSMGLDIDAEFCYANVRGLVEKARKYGRFVRLDMENSPYTDTTLDIYRRLRTDGFDNTGVVIQAYMRRSAEDIRSLSALRASVRLCKGIYIESETIAFREREEVRGNYKKLLRQIIENGMYIGIATHDDALIDDARDYLAKNSVPKEQYEFQMLLGVRENKRDELLRDGHKVRIYVPFGDDWYGYSTRRLKENPQIAGHILKAMFTGQS